MPLQNQSQQRIAESARTREQSLSSQCYQSGHLGQGESREVETLYVEADGIWLRLQREKSKQLRGAIAYAGQSIRT